LIIYAHSLNYDKVKSIYACINKEKKKYLNSLWNKIAFCLLTNMKLFQRNRINIKLESSCFCPHKKEKTWAVPLLHTHCSLWNETAFCLLTNIKIFQQNQINIKLENSRCPQKEEKIWAVPPMQTYYSFAFRQRSREIRNSFLSFYFPKPVE